MSRKKKKNYHQQKSAGANQHSEQPVTSITEPSRNGADNPITEEVTKKSNEHDNRPHGFSVRNPDWWMVGITAILAFFAGWTLAEIHGASLLEQRAWIGVEDIRGLPEMNKPLTITIVFKNTGKTPAKNVKLIDTYKGIEKGNELKFDYPPPATEESRGVIFPQSILHNDFTPGKGGTIQEIDFNRISSQQVKLFVHGKITYDDIFSNEHWTTFCYYLVAEASGWAACKEYNDTDDK